MFDISIATSLLSDIVGAAAPIAFLMVFIRIGFKALVNAAMGKKDLFSD